MLNMHTLKQKVQWKKKPGCSIQSLLNRMFTWPVLEPRVSVLPRLTLKIFHNCYLKDISEEHMKKQ